jgi:oxygen-independent coproporphyrinogen-3 oxidase
MREIITEALVQKYNVPCPRYTSYPTVPYWDITTFNAEKWEESVRKNFLLSNKNGGMSLYLHLPYCESLCTYCGCNTRITINHKVEVPYIESILKEWRLYTNLFAEKPILSELHLGGGTPTFFSPENLNYLLTTIYADCIIPEDASFSFEGHPNNTTKEHLQMFYDLGFKRVSFGIQDFDPKVQEIINRIQPLENVVRVTEEAREIGYTSVNYDLVYGLPMQQLDTVKDTVEKVIQLLPDRIAFYSYAHVPWLKPGQRKFTDADLPSDSTKRDLYELGKKMFLDAGYGDVGMDHFALPNDELTLASQNGKLHRNFMGYTAQHTKFSIGLGVSSISDTWGSFAQNVKTVEGYQKKVDEGIIPVFKGHILTDDDLRMRSHILEVMCQYRTSWKQGELSSDIIDQLYALEADGLILMGNTSFAVSEIGKAFLRNICMVFDVRLWEDKISKVQFSTSV